MDATFESDYILKERKTADLIETYKIVTEKEAVFLEQLQ